MTISMRTSGPFGWARTAWVLGLVLGALPAVALAIAPPDAAVQRFATAEFLPYIDRSAPEGGYYPALIRRVLAHHGVRAEFVDRPWARAHDETRRGLFDGSFPYVRSAARERDFLFSDPLLVVPARLFVRRQDAAGPLGADRDRHIREARRTCYLRDSLLPAFVEARAADGQLEVVRVDDMAQCFRMLEAGRVEFVAAGAYNGQSTLQRMFGKASPIVKIGGPIDRSTLHLVWPRSDPRAEARRAAFNASLAELQASGEVATLQDQLLPRAE